MAVLIAVMFVFLMYGKRVRWLSLLRELRVGVAGFRLANTKCMSDIELWKKILHPNLVQLREVFTTKAFGDNCT